MSHKYFKVCGFQERLEEIDNSLSFNQFTHACFIVINIYHFDVYCWISAWNGWWSTNSISRVFGSGQTQLKLSLWGDEFYWVSNQENRGIYNRFEFYLVSSSRIINNSTRNWCVVKFGELFVLPICVHNGAHGHLGWTQNQENTEENSTFEKKI